MLGPYYRPQLTSMLSITHRATGVLLSVAGIPLVLWWIIAVNRGPTAYQHLVECVSGSLGLLLGTVLVFSLCFHFFNGIRHLVWDTGQWLDLGTVYRTGWLVLAVSVIATAVIIGGLAWGT